ncbi:lytic murein transglycosylase B [Salinisphaera orenii]|uniref:lytic murein transglycosylase B n=1 Tax=Salinisphaera orenii TaxID=856731 RepID=UPI000DBE8BBB
MNRIIYCLLWAALGVYLISGVANAADDGFVHRAGAEKLVKQLADRGIPAAKTRQLLAATKKNSSVLDRMRNPAETRLDWGEYRAIFVTPKRARQGLRFVRQHREAFQRAERRYGVPASVVAAILGVETRYGQHMGQERVLDSLATLAFDYPPRADFFRKELRAFIKLCVQDDLDCQNLKGSYAGAIGLPQFIPTSYLAYAVDGDDDGERDLWQPADAIASVASYLSRHDWKNGVGVASRARVTAGSPAAEVAQSRPDSTNTSWARLARDGAAAFDTSPSADARVALMRLNGKNGREYWLAQHNFFVITTYNHSDLYAMAVHQLSQAIAKRLD